MTILISVHRYVQEALGLESHMLSGSVSCSIAEIRVEINNKTNTKVLVNCHLSLHKSPDMKKTLMKS